MKKVFTALTAIFLFSANAYSIKNESILISSKPVEYHEVRIQNTNLDFP